MSTQKPNPSQPESPLWTISRVLQWTHNHFQSLDIDSPRTTAEVLLAHVLGVRRLDLYLNYQQPLNTDELARYRQLIRRRCRREPVAYITGCKEFWSMDFTVDRKVLIPRPDSESLVEHALALIPDISGDRPLRVLELGVGSGAVILALASQRQGHLFFGSDRSAAALTVARGNAQHHGLASSLHWVAADWFAGFGQGRAFDLIVSNPPYIPSADLAQLAPEIYQHEPLTALDGGADGLAAIRTIVATAPAYLARGGHLLLEIGHDQAAAVQTLAAAATGLQFEHLFQDFGGRDRVVQWSRLT